MKRKMAINIGVALTAGLLLTSCGKNAQPVTGGGSNQVAPFVSAQLSPQVANLQTVMMQKSMTEGIRTLNQNGGISSSVYKFAATCTLSNNTQTNSWLGGAISFTWGINTTNCPLAQVGTDRFQSAVAEQAILVTGVAINRKEGIIDRIFNPPSTSIAKACAGTIAPTMLSAAVRSNVGGYNSGSQIIDYTFREDCPNSQPYIMHVISFEVNTSQPLVAQPISVVSGRVTQGLNGQPGQYIQEKIEQNQFQY